MDVCRVCGALGRSVVKAATATAGAGHREEEDDFDGAASVWMRRSGLDSRPRGGRKQGGDGGAARFRKFGTMANQ